MAQTTTIAGSLLIVVPIAFNVAGVALVQSTEVADWVGVLGVVMGPILMLCSLEFVGRHERTGWKVAEKLTPIA